jgi:hypothetical protein
MHGRGRAAGQTGQLGKGQLGVYACMVAVAAAAEKYLLQFAALSRGEYFGCLAQQGIDHFAQQVGQGVYLLV